MKKILCTVILSLLLNGNAFANSVSEYLKDGYKLHSVNLTSDNTALLYHLTLEVKKEKKSIKFKKEKNFIIVTCIVKAKSGETVNCYKP
jgi:hypothetical protein|tara:strand:- start:123 stop:389 length:267 start_codon:yes stop_codon:yes gene_type:complete